KHNEFLPTVGAFPRFIIP
ncbi:hypothetical protein CP02DC14_0927B, partial [Chlamydia psittaci 02DC14]